MVYDKREEVCKFSNKEKSDKWEKGVQKGHFLMAANLKLLTLATVPVESDMTSSSISICSLLHSLSHFNQWSVNIYLN